MCKSVDMHIVQCTFMRNHAHFDIRQTHAFYKQVSDMYLYTRPLTSSQYLLTRIYFFIVLKRQNRNHCKYCYEYSLYRYIPLVGITEYLQYYRYTLRQQTGNERDNKTPQLCMRMHIYNALYAQFQHIYICYRKIHMVDCIFG